MAEKKGNNIVKKVKKEKKEKSQDNTYYKGLVNAYDAFINNAYDIIHRIIGGELILFAGKATGDIVFISGDYAKTMDDICEECVPGEALDCLDVNYIPYIPARYIMDYIVGIATIDPVSSRESRDALLRAIVQNAFLIDDSDGVLTFLERINQGA